MTKFRQSARRRPWTSFLATATVTASARVSTTTVLVCVMLWLPSVSAQVPQLPRIDQFGIDGLRLMLQQQGLSATQTQIGSAFDAPQETVAVILGDLTTASRIRGQLNRFWREGGALLIASDMQEQRLPASNLCGAWPLPNFQLSSRDAMEFGYRGFRDCPIVQDFDREGTGPLFEGIDQIVTNRPGYVRSFSNVRIVATFPGRRPRPLMVINNYEETGGRMLMIADHSVFINEMLIHGDNAKFASNVTRWLCEGGRRRNLVLIHEGNVLPDWGFGETPPSIPLDTLLKAVQSSGLSGLPIGDTLLPVINDALQQAQSQNAVNAAIHKASRRFFGNRPNRWLMILMGLLLAIAFGWFARARWRPLRWLSFRDWSRSAEPKMVGAARDGHYFPYLRTLTREFFRECGAEHFDSKHAPSVVQSTKQSISRQIDELWRMATADKNQKLTRKRFRQHIQVLRDLRQLQLAGDLRLEWSNS